MVRIEIDAIDLHNFAERIKHDPEKRKAFGFAVLRTVAGYERKRHSMPGNSPSGDETIGMSESDWYRLRGQFSSPESLENT